MRVCVCSCASRLKQNEAVPILLDNMDEGVKGLFFIHSRQPGSSSSDLSDGEQAWRQGLLKNVSEVLGSQL
jgi:hypothetical protein